MILRMKTLLFGIIGNFKCDIKVTFLIGKTAYFPNTIFAIGLKTNNIAAVRHSVAMLEKIERLIATIHQYNKAVMKP